MKLSSDNIRQRELARRKKEPMWFAASVAFHIVLFAVIIFLTPVRKIVFEEKEPTKNAAEDLSADRIEDIAEDLSDVRMNELLQQILAMQAVLHNMDMMKDELAKSYDSFAEQMANADGPKNIRKELEEFIDETERNQKQSVVAQGVVRDEIVSIVETEKENYLEDNVSGELAKKSDKLMYETVEKTNTSQGNAVNALDKLQVRAEFGGFKKTAEAAAKYLEAQAEAARMQDKVQTDVVNIAQGLREVYNNEKWGVPNPTKELNSGKSWLADLVKQKADYKQQIATSRSNVDQLDKELADLKKQLEELEK